MLEFRENLAVEGTVIRGRCGASLDKVRTSRRREQDR